MRFVSKQLASYVAADADGVTICEYGEETHRHPWAQVTFAGHVLAADGSELLYVYVESADRLLTILPRVRELPAAARRAAPPTYSPPTWSWRPANPGRPPAPPPAGARRAGVRR